MKRMKYQFYTAATLVLLTALSCRKNQDKNDAAEIAQQSGLAYKSMNDLGVMSAEAISGSFLTFASSCDTIIYDTLGTAKSITIDFGTAGCESKDGKIRTGKVIVSTAGVFNGIGEANKMILTTNNYRVNGHQVEGTRTTTRVNTTKANVSTKTTVTLKDNKGVFTWNSDFVRKFISGDATPYVHDDEYELTGKGSGINTKDVVYQIEITEALLVQTGCRSIKAGVLEITADNMKNEATLNYGDGSCDDKAILKYGKKEVELSL